MSSFANLQEAKDFFAGDRYAYETGVVLEEIYDGGAACSLTLTEHHRNAEGGVMGGVIFTDMCTDLERCSDQAINIATALVNKRK